MYTNRTRSDILDEMLVAVRDDVDKREGSVVHDMLAPPAEEFEMLGFVLEAILENGFIDTAQAEFVDKRAAELGIYRKPAEFAKGVLNIAGVAGTEIEVGSRIIAQVRGVSVGIETVDYAVISDEGFVAVNAIASEAGTSGNISADAEFTSEAFRYDSITAQSPFDGGIDVEPDDELKARYLLKVRKPITSGNVFQYELWAREVEGISQARIVPLWDGNGTVKVIVIDPDGRAPLPAKVEAVQAHIDAVKPIGATITVIAIKEVPVNITVKLSLEGDLSPEDVAQDVEDSIAAYLAEADETVRYSQIASALLDTEGVRDYSGLLIGTDAESMGADNLDIDGDVVAVVGTVTLS